jgi:hypothetical protein
MLALQIPDCLADGPEFIHLNVTFPGLFIVSLNLPCRVDLIRSHFPYVYGQIHHESQD